MMLVMSSTVLGAGTGLGETWDTILHWALIIGLALFFWSVASSMEQIAKALTRMADDKDAKRSGGAPNELPKPD